MVPPDFNRMGRMNLTFARNFAITTPTTANGPSAFFIRLQVVSSGGALYSLSPFGLNVCVLHFRNVHGVYVKRQFSSGSAVPLTNAAQSNDSARRAGWFRLLLGRFVRLQPRAPFHVFSPHRDAGMAVMLFLFVLIVLYHRTPE